MPYKFFLPKFRRKLLITELTSAGKKVKEGRREREREKEKQCIIFIYF